MKSQSMSKTLRDKWILVLVIPFVGFVMPLIFNGFSITFLFSEGYQNLVSSIGTTILIWLGIRKIVIALWHKYPWEKNPIKHLVCEIILVFSYTMLIGFLNYLLSIWTGVLGIDDDTDIVMAISITLLVTFLITSIHEAWFFFNQWNISLVKAQALEKENVISQYETLKTQINPHFLFNTLNTLTTLIEEDPKKAVGYVDKTADFLRSILGMKDKEVITLEEEVRIVETFYFLQKERFGNNLHLEIHLSPASMKRVIPPLVLQMLIENAIKHNVISVEKPLHVSVRDEGGTLIIVENNLQIKKQEKPSSGIGLQNIKNRYQFLTDHQIHIIETPDRFTVKVPLLEG
jgi:hypothetical protein